MLLAGLSSWTVLQSCCAAVISVWCRWLAVWYVSTCTGIRPATWQPGLHHHPARVVVASAAWCGIFVWWRLRQTTGRCRHCCWVCCCCVLSSPKLRDLAWSPWTREGRGQWMMKSVLWVTFSALTLTVGSEEGHRKNVPLIPKDVFQNKSRKKVRMTTAKPGSLGTTNKQTNKQHRFNGQDNLGKPAPER